MRAVFDSADIDYGESMWHIGDIVVHPDASRVYAPLSRFGAFFGYDKFQIATFSTTNLQYITHWNFTGIINAIANGVPGDYDLAGLTIHEHANGLHLYAILWNETLHGTNMWVCAAHGNKVRRIKTPAP